MSVTNMGPCGKPLTRVDGRIVHQNNGRAVSPVLHKLIKQRSFAAAIERVLSPHSRHEAGVVDEKTRNLPIIIALKTSSPLFLIQILFEAYWYEEVMDTLGKLGQEPPLLVAVKEGRPMIVIKYLIKVSGLRSLRKDKNKDAQFPLHLAARANLDVIQTLIDADIDINGELPDHPVQAARQPDIFGALPLHCFIRHHSKLASIECLLYAYSDSISHADSQGMLPLHYVMMNDASLLTLQCILTAYPQATQIADSQGNLPIFCAFQEGSHTANLAPKIDIMLRAYPKAILHTNIKGETLFTMAQRMKKSGLVSSWCFNAERLIDNVLNRTFEEWISLRKAKLGNFKRLHECISVDIGDVDQSKNPAKKQLKLADGVEINNDKLLFDEKKMDKRTLILTAFSRVILRALQIKYKKLKRDMQKCVVCWDNIISFAIVPCGHMALCVDCSKLEKIIELGGCPVDNCSQRIFRAQKVHSIGTFNEEGNEKNGLDKMFDNRCVVCLDGMRTQILLPCGHLALCTDCAKRDTIRKLDMKCPLCRCTIFDAMEIKMVTE